MGEWEPPTRALTKLGKLGKRAAPAAAFFCENLTSDVPAVRELALWCIRQLGEAGAEMLPDLGEALGDANTNVRAEALRAVTCLAQWVAPEDVVSLIFAQIQSR